MLLKNAQYQQPMKYFPNISDSKVLLKYFWEIKTKMVVTRGEREVGKKCEGEYSQ